MHSCKRVTLVDAAECSRVKCIDHKLPASKHSIFLRDLCCHCWRYSAEVIEMIK
jgi:hypothetical protein